MERETDSHSINHPLMLSVSPDVPTKYRVVYSADYKKPGALPPSQNQVRVLPTKPHPGGPRLQLTPLGGAFAPCG